jgi:hypothetical protein
MPNTARDFTDYDANAAMLRQLGIREYWTVREDYQVGDLFWFLGAGYRIQKIVPYPERPGIDISHLGEDPQVFICEGGFEITRTKRTSNHETYPEHCPPGYFRRIAEQHGI